MRISVARIARRLFFGVGIVLLAYAGGMAAYADIYQRYQSWMFDQDAARSMVLNAAAIVEVETELEEGSLIGRIEIPRSDISVMVLHGMEAQTLVSGAGHVPATPLPGGDGNIVIAAHRDTFFRKLEGILPGDSIRFTTEKGIFEYVVQSTEIVDPEDTRAMESRGRNELTLITCFPFYFVGSAPKRFVVHALPRD